MDEMEEDRPVKVAFCKILFGKNGGTFTAENLPIFHEMDDEDLPPAGKCDRPFDCGQCELMHEFLVQRIAEGWGVGWECDACLKATEELDKQQGLERHLQGFYQEGRAGLALPGCTRCGWESAFLQLVMRRRT